MRPVLPTVLLAAALSTSAAPVPAPSDLALADRKTWSLFHAWIRTPDPVPSARERRDHLGAAREAAAHMELVLARPGLGPRLFRLYCALAGRESCLTFGWHDGGIGWGPLAMGRHAVVATCLWRGILPPKPRKSAGKAMAAAWESRCESEWARFRSDRGYCVRLSVAQLARCLARAGWDVRNAAMLHHRPSDPRGPARGRYLSRVMFLYAELWDEPMPLRLDSVPK